MIEATFTAKVVSLSLTQSAGERSNCSSSTPTRMGQRYCPDLSDCWSYPPGSAGGIGCVRHTPYPRLRRRYLPPCFAWGTDPFRLALHGGLIHPLPPPSAAVPSPTSWGTNPGSAAVPSPTPCGRERLIPSLHALSWGTDPGSRFLPRLCWGSAALGGEEVGSPVVSVWRRIDPLGGSVPCQVRFGLTPPHP